MHTIQLAKDNPKAFAALPEAYQADDCLEFFMGRIKRIGRTFIMCRPKKDQESILGNWSCMFIPEQQRWVKRSFE